MTGQQPADAFPTVSPEPPGPGQWAAVILMVLGFAIATFAFVAQLIWLGIVGGVIGATGVICAKVFHLMQTTH
ncbi:MAG: hypothetical protein ACYDB7_06380 [Mycobacteriales bacterium]